MSASLPEAKIPPKGDGWLHEPRLDRHRPLWGMLPPELAPPGFSLP
jgi:hypothetical protein